MSYTHNRGDIDPPTGAGASASDVPSRAREWISSGSLVEKRPPVRLISMPFRKPGEPLQPTLRQSQARLTETERRIDLILARMESGDWLAGVSDRAFAADWRCTPDHVRRLASEANRVLRRQLRDDPEAQAAARAEILQLARVIRARAMANGDAGSLRVALEALRLYGAYLGLEPARQLAIHETNPFEGWSTEDKLAFACTGKRPRKAAAKLTERV